MISFNHIDKFVSISGVCCIARILNGFSSSFIISCTKNWSILFRIPCCSVKEKLGVCRNWISKIWINTENTLDSDPLTIFIFLRSKRNLGTSSDALTPKRLWYLLASSLLPKLDSRQAWAMVIEASTWLSFVILSEWSNFFDEFMFINFLKLCFRRLLCLVIKNFIID